MEFINIFGVFFTMLVSVKSDCKLSLNDDFNEPQPIFAKDGAMIAPGRDGVYRLKEGETVTVACPGKDRTILFGQVAFNNISVDVECIFEQSFRVTPWESDFKDIRCNSLPIVTAKTNPELCFGGNNILSIGYRVGKHFYKLYDACFDSEILTTYYVIHKLTPALEFKQTFPKDGFFGKDKFGKFDIGSVYDWKVQKGKINAILGSNLADPYFDENHKFVEKQLVPTGDFALRSAQRSTYHYVNVVPHWKLQGEGDWDALEDSLRKRVMKDKELTVYTGTFAITTLPNTIGVHKELYLHIVPHKLDSVPVPLYLYKFVYDPEKKVGTVFMTINNPHYTTREIDELLFCNDLCMNNNKFSWLKWQRNDNITSFCCTYSQVKHVVFTFPNVEVKGIFY